MESLAKGGVLNADSFADFVKRLTHDCRGKGVEDHCTSEAFYIVERKVKICGIDSDYTDKLMAFCDESSWYAPIDCWRDFTHEEKITLNKKCVDEWNDKFLKLSESTQWEMLDGFNEISVVGYMERWDYVNAHFTKDAAEAFIRRKKHDYPDGLRVYVESQYWSWEFNAIKNAIMDGTLIFKPNN